MIFEMLSSKCWPFYWGLNVWIMSVVLGMSRWQASSTDYRSYMGNMPKQTIAMMTWNRINIEKSSLSKTLATCFHSSDNAFSFSSDFTFSLSTRNSLSSAGSALAVSPLVSTSSRTVTPGSSSGSLGLSVGSTWPRRQHKRQEKISLVICSHLGTGRIGVIWCIFINIICIKMFAPQIVTVTVRYTAVMEGKIGIYFMFNTLRRGQNSHHLQAFVLSNWYSWIEIDVFHSISS